MKNNCDADENKTRNELEHKEKGIESYKAIKPFRPTTYMLTRKVMSNNACKRLVPLLKLLNH